MTLQIHTTYRQLESSGHHADFQRFLDLAEHDNYFQSADFLRFIEGVKGYKPVLILAFDGMSRIAGTLLGVYQSNGNGMKSWLSRRLIVWGGPLLAADALSVRQEVVANLLEALKKHAQGNAIFIEFRNFFDTSDLQGVFEASGFHFKAHLNYLVRTDTVEAARNRLSSNRRRQIKTSLAAGAVVTEPESEADVLALYGLLEKLYREKVKKPLPGPELFLETWKSPTGKIFLVKYDGEVVGGSVGPMYRNKVLYQWYVCGDNGTIKGVHPSVLASWAPIEFGALHGYDTFDFMGAGRPEEDYGVREFKARFGGDEVCFGRYEMVLNKPLYTVGKLGLKVYQRIK